MSEKSSIAGISGLVFVVGDIPCITLARAEADPIDAVSRREASFWKGSEAVAINIFRFHRWAVRELRQNKLSFPAKALSCSPSLSNGWLERVWNWSVLAVCVEKTGRRANGLPGYT